MYYQVQVETSEKVGKSGQYKQLFELDKTDLEEIIDDFIIPYLKKDQFQFDGYFLSPKEIKHILVKETKKTTEELSKFENDNMSPNVIMFISRSDILSFDKHADDITKEIFKKANEKISSSPPKETKPTTTQVKLDTNKVFIVHGHDNLAKTEVARFIEKLGFEPIILHEQASSGKTIIEKIESYSNVGFGVVLYTPCDFGASQSDKKDVKSRARQNVVFEHGYLIGKLTRSNVCALVKGEVEKPNDISGVVYIPMDNRGAWQIALSKEMRNSGYDVDMNKVI